MELLELCIVQESMKVNGMEKTKQMELFNIYFAAIDEAQKLETKINSK